MIDMNDWLAGFLSGILGLLLVPALFGSLSIGSLNNSSILGKIFMSTILILLLLAIWYFKK